MNYTVSNIKIKSSWFDEVDNKKSIYKRIGYKGLYLYFQLYKFKLYGQESEDTFITSISFMRKETGYSTDEIFDLLKRMKNCKIIKLLNVSRWDYLLDDNGNIKDKDILHIVACDLPVTERKVKKDRNGNVVKDKDGNDYYIDSPIDDNNYYIAISFKLFDYYKSKKLNERYCALYCLIARWSNGHMSGKMNMKIENIASILDFDKDYVHKMIYQMNRNYLLATYRKVRQSGGYKFEHYILSDCSENCMKRFLETHKENIDKLVKRGKKMKLIE